MRTERLPFTLEASISNLQAEYESHLDSTNAKLNNRELIIKDFLNCFSYFGFVGTFSGDNFSFAVTF